MNLEISYLFTSYLSPESVISQKLAAVMTNLLRLMGQNTFDRARCPDAPFDGQQVIERAPQLDHQDFLGRRERGAELVGAMGATLNIIASTPLSNRGYGEVEVIGQRS